MKALLLVDIQNDFLPGGALAVPQGDEVIPVANLLQLHFDRVIATQDWHPEDHGSFASNHSEKQPGEVVELAGQSQILWPVHCVQGTPGAELAPGLERAKIEKLFFKGVDPQVDSYSAFFDNAAQRSTGLIEYLRMTLVDEIYILGLATDYCVKFSALDAAQLGLRTTVIEDGCRGVELAVGDSKRAFDAMQQAGVDVVSSSEILGAGAPVPAVAGLRAVTA
ncbi:MAG: bifunctional nicotinamidase/pyrazinamidase [Acidobacteriota bacterium]